MPVKEGGARGIAGRTRAKVDPSAARSRARQSGRTFVGRTRAAVGAGGPGEAGLAPTGYRMNPALPERQRARGGDGG